MQYAVSIADRMEPYFNEVTIKQENFYIESVTGIINAEIEKGAEYEGVIYVAGKPSVLIFNTHTMPAVPASRRSEIRRSPSSRGMVQPKQRP